jgi:hypothetical protein
VWLGLVLLSACASAPTKPVGRSDLLQFLDQPGITRQQVIAQLGPPSDTFLRDNIVTYRLGHNAEGYFVVPPHPGKGELGWEGVDYDLVLAFNSDQTLREHRLVAIRAAPATP